MTTQELALTESRTLRSQYADRVEVLDRVKALSLLPDGVHVTTEIVADFYEVPIPTIKSLVHDNRTELEDNGYTTLSGEQLSSFKELSGISSRARELALFTKRAVYNVGMLLRDSAVARQVRTEALNAVAPEQSLDELEAAKRYVAALEREQQLAKELATVRPKAESWETLAAADGDLSVGDAPKGKRRPPVSSRTREDVLREAAEIADQAPAATEGLRDRIRMIFKSAVRRSDAA